MRRRGSVYIAVLGACLIVTTLAVGGILAGRVQARASNLESDLSDARLSAASGLELARVWISKDDNWRSNRASGDWATALNVGSGSVTISVTDPLDGSLSNRPTDPVTITATGQKGQARHVSRMTLSAKPVPLSSLAYAIHTPGQLHVRAGHQVSVGSAVLSTNGGFRNDGTVEGSAIAGSVTAAGIVYGGVTTGATARATPPSTVADLYAALGTEISVTTIDKRILSPGVNPWGTVNAEGVYVIRSGSDVTIKCSRIVGTLVIICPGKKVTLDGDLVTEPSRSDYPSLIVVGDLVVKCAGADTYLSEAGESTNYNPVGAPSNGVTDSDKTDNYVCQLKGLIYATGRIQIMSNVTIRGAIISASTLATDAVDIDADPTIKYDKSLYTNPPMGFTTSVPMAPVAGSYSQVVN